MSSVWRRPSNSELVREVSMTLRLLSTTPFGLPVVPDVYNITAVLS